MDDLTTVKLHEILIKEHSNIKFLAKCLDDELCRFSHVEDKIDVCEVITRCNQLLLHANALKTRMAYHVPDFFNPDGIVEPVDFSPEDHDDAVLGDDDEYYDPNREHPRESIREPLDRFKYE